MHVRYLDPDCSVGLASKSEIGDLIDVKLFNGFGGLFLGYPSNKHKVGIWIAMAWITN